MPKASLIHDLTVNRDALLTLCDGLTEKEIQNVVVVDRWAIQDLVGHLSYWEHQTLNHLRETFKEGKPRPMPPNGTDDNINGREADKRKGWSWQRVRAEFEHTRNALIERVHALSESDLQFNVPSPWVNDERFISLETLIREDVLGHGQEHLDELVKWRQQHINAKPV